MSIFYNISMFRWENFKHVFSLLILFVVTFLGMLGIINFVLSEQQATLLWQTLRTAPVIFGTLTYVVLGISLSFLSYKSITKIICFTAVVADSKNKALINAFLVNLFLLNLFASSMIAGYIVLYFWQPTASIGHLLSLAQASLIFPITYCMRVLEGCIDKIINLETDVENNCLRFIKFPD